MFFISDLLQQCDDNYERRSKFDMKSTNGGKNLAYCLKCF